VDLRTSEGRPVRLGAQLGSGGEASVHEVMGKTDVAAKIYHRADADRRQKVEVMIQRPPPLSPSHVTMAWPDDLLFEPSGRFVGFTMPRLRAEARTIRTAFNPARRAVELPGFTYRYVVQTAANLAEAMTLVHRAGHVIGDVNESNALVTPSALVTLVDCDSMQIRAADRTYRCGLAKAEYLAPELVGETLGATDRTEASDAFALAVIVHQLLFNGVRPHDGVTNGGNLADDVSERIRLEQTPLNPRSGIAPPPFAPPLASIPSRLQAMLRLSFSIRPDDRPSSRDWAGALQAATRSLKTCTASSSHLYFETAIECPWCALIRRGVPDAFGPRAPRQQPRHSGKSNKSAGSATAGGGHTAGLTGAAPPLAGVGVPPLRYFCAWISGSSRCSSNRMIDSKFCWAHASQAERKHAQRMSPNGCVAVTQRQKPCRATPSRYASEPTCANHPSGGVWTPATPRSSSSTTPPSVGQSPAPTATTPPSSGTPPTGGPGRASTGNSASNRFTGGVVQPTPGSSSTGARPTVAAPATPGAATTAAPSGYSSAALTLLGVMAMLTLFVATGLAHAVAEVSVNVWRWIADGVNAADGPDLGSLVRAGLAVAGIASAAVVATRRPDIFQAIGRFMLATGKFTLGVLKVMFHVLAFVTTTTEAFLGWLFRPGCFMRIVWIGVGVSLLVSGCTAVLRAVGFH